MAKKIKKNKFGLSKPGSKKEQEYNYKMKVRLEARKEMLEEFTTVLAWVLRAKYNFGKKRIEQMIEDVYELKSDTTMKEHGQDLLSIEDIPPQLLEEVGLDIYKLIGRLAWKHIQRIEELKHVE